MNKGMSEIVRHIARLVSPFIFIFGVSLVLFGHISPGGGFAGGVVIACCFLLRMLALGSEEALKTVSIENAEIFHSAGTLGFLLIGALGIAAGAFMYNFAAKGTLFHLWSGGTILVNNVMIGVKIGAALFAVILLLAMWRPEKAGEAPFSQRDED